MNALIFPPLLQNLNIFGRTDRRINEDKSKCAPSYSKGIKRIIFKQYNSTEASNPAYLLNKY